MESYYEITLKNGKIIHSNDDSWLSFAHPIRVSKAGELQVVYASFSEIASLRVVHQGLEKVLDVPEGCSVYQSIQAHLLQSSESGAPSERILGRFLGLVREGQVIEEYFLDGIQGIVTGYRYDNI